MKLLLSLSLAASLVTGLAMAQESSSSSAASSVPPPPAPVVEHWNTDEGGAMTLKVLPQSFDGTYENDNGRINGVLKDGVWNGYWGEDGSNQECPTAQLGTKFWGRIAFTFNADRTHFDGKWSYCDEDPSKGWSGDVAK